MWNFSNNILKSYLVPGLSSKYMWFQVYWISYLFKTMNISLICSLRVNKNEKVSPLLQGSKNNQSLTRIHYWKKKNTNLWQISQFNISCIYSNFLSQVMPILLIVPLSRQTTTVLLTKLINSTSLSMSALYPTSPL